MIIAFDVDDVLADLVPAWLRAYNREFNDTLTIDDVHGWDITQFVKPECGAMIYRYLNNGLYDTIHKTPGALAAVQTARALGKVIFVTASLPAHAGRKLQWLNEQGFGVEPDEYIECSDKGLVAADVLIDDRPVNLDAFKGAHKILMNKPWNQEYLGAPRIFSLQDPCLEKWLTEWSQPEVGRPGTTLDDVATKAVKLDTLKPRMELLSPWVLMMVAQTLTLGARKYSSHNWRKGFDWTRPVGAALRHIMSWLMGENLDSEWQIPHLAHAICELMFALEHEMLGHGTDDRWQASPEQIALLKSYLYPEVLDDTK